MGKPIFHESSCFPAQLPANVYSVSQSVGDPTSEHDGAPGSQCRPGPRPDCCKHVRVPADGTSVFLLNSAFQIKEAVITMYLKII